MDYGRKFGHGGKGTSFIFSCVNLLFTVDPDEIALQALVMT